MKAFAQDRGIGTTPAAGVKAGTTQGTFTTSDAIPWKPVDPKKPDGVQIFVVWGNPNKGPSEILLKFPAGMDVGWHWHTAAYHGVVIQGKHTHTFKGTAPQRAGRDPCGHNLQDRSMMTSAKRAADCIVVAYFHGKLDFNPVKGGAKGDHETQQGR